MFVIEFMPRNLHASWIGSPRSVFAGHAINATEYIGLVKLRCWAADLVPTTGVNNYNAPIGVFLYICGMEVDVIAFEKWQFLSFKGRAFLRELITKDFS